MPTPRRNLQQIALRIAQQVQARAGKGVQAAAIFLAARLKETVSTPAPRKRVINNAGDIRYVATVRAIRGAPPRKLSGKLRQSITHAAKLPPGGTTGGGQRGRIRPVLATVGVMARSAKGFNYPRHLERTNHRFLLPTVRKYRKELVTLVGGSLRVRAHY